MSNHRGKTSPNNWNFAARVQTHLKAHWEETHFVNRLFALPECFEPSLTVLSNDHGQCCEWLIAFACKLWFLEPSDTGTRKMRKILSIAMTAAILLPALPVAADPPSWAPAHGRRAKDSERDYDRGRDDDREHDGDRRHDRDQSAYFVYRDDHHHHERRLVRYDEVVYRGGDGRYYCHRSDGTTGLIVGAVAGGVIGNQLTRGKSAALGTVLGAGAGALIGQAIDKDRVYCE